MKYLGYAQQTAHPGKITIVVERGFWFWKRILSYRGNCTVWHNVKTGKRASTSTEKWLSACEQRILNR